MTKALIITEGVSDAQILQKVLPQEVLEQVQIIPSGGSALSLARTVLVTKRLPTVLLVDADSNNESAIHEKQSDLNELLNSVSIDTKYKVMLVVPEIEVLFLESPDFVKHLSVDKKDFSPFELELARSSPRKFLIDIAGKKDSQGLYAELFENLDEETLSAMKNHKVIKDLTDFLYSVLNDSQTPSMALEK